ncbi:MAG: hypothetical protein ABI978_01475 [Chloroflexota bacterium]
MFGRRNRETKEAREAAAREQSRRALFEELAKRPPDICPFLGLASSQTEYHTGVTREHRCYAFGEPAELSAEQQERVCLGRGYGNCPRYLRGVLVIPTEELEALRRPLPPAPVRPPAPPTPPPPIAQASGDRGRRAPLLIGLLLLLAVAGASGAFLFLRNGGTGVLPTTTPTPSLSSAPSSSGTASPSSAPTATPIGASQTPFPETPKPDPTPLPGDTFIGYEVTVLEGQNTLFEIDAGGNVVSQVIAHYDRFSKAAVDRIEAPNGLLHWRTAAGFFKGLSYVHGNSGPFLIRKKYQGTDGQLRYIVLKDSET